MTKFSNAIYVYFRSFADAPEKVAVVSSVEGEVFVKGEAVKSSGEWIKLKKETKAKKQPVRRGRKY